MTVCDLCKGTGRLIKPWYDTTGLMMGMTGDVCFMCDGKGTVVEPMTNEEWLRSISTREFAKELALLVLYDMPLYDRLHNVFEGGESAVIDECEKWLKEIHEERP